MGLCFVDDSLFLPLLLFLVLYVSKDEDQRLLFSWKESESVFKGSDWRPS